MRNVSMEALAATGNVVLEGIPNPTDRSDRKCGDVIAAGPISLQPFSVAFRVVLRATERGEFVVHNQMFPNYTNNRADFTGSFFSDGDYYPAGELPEATHRFTERLRSMAPTLQSVYRDVPHLSIAI